MILTVLYMLLLLVTSSWFLAVMVVIDDIMETLVQLDWKRVIAFGGFSDTPGDLWFKETHC